MINNSKMRKAIQEFVNKYTHIEINEKKRYQKIHIVTNLGLNF